MKENDPRVTPARDDIAAAKLRSIVKAPRYAEGHTGIVSRGIAPLREEPREDAGLNTQLLYGERFTVYDEKSGWSWGQAERDHYVGYVRSDALVSASIEATHRVAALGTPLLPAPDVKRAARDVLPLNAVVKVVGEEGNFALVEHGDFVFRGHLKPIGETESDWVGVAERFLGAPYIWGGKAASGCDCSGLVQAALEAGGIASPRDTDMMEESLGAQIDPSRERGFRRGDLVFWKDHVGIMLDATRLLHANAFHMEVAIEPLEAAAKRIAQTDGAIRTIRRMG